MSQGGLVVGEGVVGKRFCRRRFCRSVGFAVEGNFLVDGVLS